MGVAPLLNGLFASRLGLNWQQLGWLAAAGQAGTLAGTLLAYGLLSREAVRAGLRFGALCATLAWLQAAMTESFHSLLVLRALTGLGTGCVFAIGTYALARSAQPARSFSINSGIQVVCASAHVAVLSDIEVRFGYVVAVASVAVWFLFVLALTWQVPARITPRIDVDTTEAVGSPRLPGRYVAIGSLVSVMAFQCGVITFWIYSERIAAASGLSARAIGTAIALGNLGGLVGAIVGAFSGVRFGYLPILLLATAGVAAGEIIMFSAVTAQAHLIGQFAFNFGWMLGVSYYLALLARHASEGLLKMAPPALVVAGALGPLWIAVFAGNSASELLSMSLVLAVVALIPALFAKS